MLKLKKVQILGFKSFCDKTEVLLAGNGIAAIVGPNGCGKSNISDAITWVLGEQSAKSLRGLRMEDVIFAGTRERKPTGMAEVSLTLVDPDVYEGTDDVNSSSDLTIDSLTPTDWDETSLRRDDAAHTEGAIADAQPGAVLDSVGNRADEPNRVDAETTLPANVTLKIRRRKFARSPIRAGELTITRRLFRSGESEYLLNGKMCRLRDIQDIFMGTGLGGDSYAIIGQDRIGQLLSSRPQDRRSIIEEAAGITRFKAKKRLAELRLEAARGNLSRVNDIFEEVTKQLTTLKRQAAKAERYGQVRDELRTKLRIVLASRITQLDRDQSFGIAKIAELTLQIDAQAKDVEAMDRDHTERVRCGYTLDEQVRDQTMIASHTAVELERISARTAANRDRTAELKVRLTTGAEEVVTAREHLSGLDIEQERLRSFLDSAMEQVGNSAKDAQRLQQAAQEAVQAVRAREQHAEESRRRAMQLIQRANQVENEQTQATAALASLERESERLLAESVGAREELATLGVQRGQVKMSFESVSERLTRLELEIASCRLKIGEGRSTESQSRQRANQLRGEVASLNGQVRSAEGLIRDHAYSTDTVKNILRASNKRISQTNQQNSTLGTLADFLEVEEAYEQVIDEFLHEELNFIVVKSWDAANEGMELLRSDVAGRATFLVESEQASAASPLGDVRPGVTLVPAERARPLRECIQVLNGFGTSLQALLPKLRDGFVTPNTETARTLALAHPDGYFLSPTGETFHNVTVTGGRVNSGGPLALKRELREMQTKLVTLEKELATADLRTLNLQHEIATHTAVIEAKSHERREVEREVANSGAALQQMESETARIERRLGEWVLATERNRSAQSQKADLIADRQTKSVEFETQRSALEVELADLNLEVERLRLEREESQQAFASAAASLARLEERRRNAQTSFEQTSQLFRSHQHRIGQLDQQLASAEQERQRREEETLAFALQHDQIAQTQATALAEVSRLTLETQEVRSATVELDRKLRIMRTETEILREQRAGLSSQCAKLASDIEHIETICLNDLAVPASELRDDREVVRVEGEALQVQESEARALKQRLEAMGPVNMMALEEYSETAERHGFLETQRKDLLDAIENTQASIKEIDDVSRVKFDEAYKVINENFSISFAKLFGGGQAFMRLTDPDNPNSDASGIEIVASPPGKKLQNILLLSGGEKALTALALLVGIFQFQPAPFCILDEVDAPLDESNVGRYAKLISEMAVNTQFIAITHNKRTMQQADVIYGVTMQEPGVSKIVSVSLGQGNRSRDQERDLPRRVA